MCVGVCQSVQQREKQREEKTGRREDNRRRGGVSDQAGGGKWSPKAPRGSKVRWYQHATNAIKATSVPFATTSPHTHLPGQQKKPGWGGERSKAGAGQGAKQKEKKAKGERRPPSEEEAKNSPPPENLVYHFIRQLDCLFLGVSSSWKWTATCFPGRHFNVFSFCFYSEHHYTELVIINPVELAQLCTQQSFRRDDFLTVGNREASIRKLGNEMTKC